MKTIIAIFAMTCALIVQAQQIKFEKYSSLDEASALAKKAGKPIFIDTYASWCGWCKYMDQNIFNDPGVAAFFNEQFINIKVDADKSSSANFTNKFDISGLPALLILDENGELLVRSDGAITDAEDFIEFGQSALYQIYPETGPWHQSRIHFQNGERGHDFLVDHAFNLLDADAEDTEIDEVVRVYWETTPTKNLIEENNLLMYFVFTDELDDELTKKFMSQKKELLEEYGEDLIYEKYISLIQINLYDAIDANDRKKLEAVKQFTREAFNDSSTVDVDEILEEINEIWREES